VPRQLCSVLTLPRSSDRVGHVERKWDYVLRGKQDEKRASIRMRQCRGIQFEPLDGEELSLRLKYLPEIVDDFFGREWALQFCGPDAAQILAERLKPVEIGNLRVSLRDCYTSLFASVDPGVLSRLPSSSAGRISVQLADRYVPPDFWLSRDVAPP